MADRKATDWTTADGLPRLGPKDGLCNELYGDSERALIRCDKPAGHFGKHSGTCGWGGAEWDQDEPRRLIPISETT